MNKPNIVPIILLVLIILGACGFAGLSVFNQPVEEVKAVPSTFSVEIGEGIVLPGTFVQAITGSDNVRVYGTDTLIAVKGYNEQGQLEITLPKAFSNNLGMLTVSEAQEYVLRILMKSENSNVDTSVLVLDSNVLQEMANDTNIQRVEQPSAVFNTYLFSDLAKHAIDKNVELSKHSMDTQKDVTLAGYTAITAVAMSADWSGAFSFLGIGVICAILAWILFGRKANS